MTSRKQFAIIVFQSQCLIEYCRYAKISTQKASELFKKYNLFEFISNGYDILEFDSIEYIVKHYISDRIKNHEKYVNIFKLKG